MPEPEKSVVDVSGEAEKTASKPIDTIYEPYPVRPVKQPKVSSNAAPIVKSLLSGINASPTAAHHPQCSCAVCKPV